MLEGQVSHVGDQVGQKVATHTVLLASHHAAKLGGQILNYGILLFAFRLIPLEQEGTGDHRVGVVPFDVDHKEVLRLVDEVLPLAIIGLLQDLSKLELQVVNKPAR